MIALADPHIPFIKEALEGKVDVRISRKLEFNREFIIKNKIEALFIRSGVKVNKELLNGTKVKFVATATSGIDHVDTNFLYFADIPFFAAPGSNANSVAEFVIYSILKWIFLADNEIENKRIGIIGYGNIGKLVEKYSNLLGLEVWVNDPPLEKQGFNFPENVQLKSLEEIFSYCDIVTNHVPLTKFVEFPTYGLIDENLLKMLREGVLFVHTSRGKVVDESALKEIMQSRKIHISIDVWENEPRFDSFLAKNALIALPHLSGYSYDGKLKGAISVLKNFENTFHISPDYSKIESLLNQFSQLEIDYTNPVSVFQTLQKNRDFESDYRTFLQYVDFPDSDKEKAFIEIRKNYPKRRESLH